MGSDFSSSTDGNFTVTCTLDGDTLSDSVDVIVLPPEVDPLFGDLQNSIETLDELNVAVVAADEAEDVLALQALKDAILAQIGAIDTAALAANPPLPNDADKPLDSQWEDDGDVRDPLVDDPWKAAVLAIRQNIMDFGPFSRASHRRPSPLRTSPRSRILRRNSRPSSVTSRALIHRTRRLWISTTS